GRLRPHRPEGAQHDRPPRRPAGVGQQMVRPRPACGATAHDPRLAARCPPGRVRGDGPVPGRRPRPSDPDGPHGPRPRARERARVRERPRPRRPARRAGLAPVRAWGVRNRRRRGGVHAPGRRRAPGPRRRNARPVYTARPPGPGHGREPDRRARTVRALRRQPHAPAEPGRGELAGRAHLPGGRAASPGGEARALGRGDGCAGRRAAVRLWRRPGAGRVALPGRGERRRRADPDRRRDAGQGARGAGRGEGGRGNAPGGGRPRRRPRAGTAHRGDDDGLRGRRRAPAPGPRAPGRARPRRRGLGGGESRLGTHRRRVRGAVPGTPRGPAHAEEGVVSRRMVVPTSLIIASRNRPGMLRETVASILAGTALPAELIIVDQSDRPDETLERMEGEADCRIRYLWPRLRGLCRANNLGAREAAYETLVFTHDDVSVDPARLATLHGALVESGPDTVVTGRILAGETGRTGGYAPTLRTSTEPATYRGRIGYDVLKPLNMAMFRSALETAGGFDE